MQHHTKLGGTLLAAGTASAFAAVDAAEHHAGGLAVATGLAAGAFTALGATALIVGWATRRPGEKADKH